MNKPTKTAALAAAGSLVSIALLISACSSPSAAPTGSPFQSGTASSVTAASAVGSASTGSIHSAPATATVTVTGSTLSGGTTAATAGSRPVSTGSDHTPTTEHATPTSTAPLNYATTLAAPPVPIGAAGTQVTPTVTMETVTPTAMTKAPYAAIATPTHIPRPADMKRTNPVQLAAAFVSLMEATSATDSRADNAALRAAPFAVQDLRDLLASQSVTEQQPAVGTNRITIRSAVVTAAADKTVTVAVLYDRITIISASENYNQQKLLLRVVTLKQGTDSAWLVSGYRLGAN